MTEPLTLQTGLFTRDEEPVPLDGVTIDAEISGLCARVTVMQRFVNREPHPIEAVYVFPLDEAAAVCGFEAIIDGTLVVGHVEEREKAFRTYDDAMERGDGAFLLDEERPDVFQASVGNLPPGKEALLRLTYVTELTVADGRLRFTIPTTVSPRYAPREDRLGVGRPDSEALNPPVAWRVPYGLSLSIALSMPGRISRLESPSHPIAVTANGHNARVTLSTRDVALDRDFVLAADVEDLDVPQAWIERSDDGTYAASVTFVPTFPAAQQPAEVIFLVDRSGSMEGTSIQEVRNALQLCLRSMIAGCRFNIVGFGTTLESLFPRSRRYDEASLADASAHVSTLQANLGGTDILPALQFALEQPRSELPRQIVVLTDGEVTNTDAVLTLAREHVASARIFTFGIGAGASHHLVRGLARAGAGAAEFVYPGERLERKVVRQFARLLSLRLTDVCIEWGGLTVTQVPATVAPVFAGDRLLLYAFLEDAHRATARLTASGPDGPLAFEVTVDPSAAVAGKTVATLAARARIRELEESDSWAGSRGSRQRDRGDERVKHDIVALGVKYGLISRETSYVAIERRDTPAAANVQLRRVPIALTKDWGGLEGVLAGTLLGTARGAIEVCRAPAYTSIGLKGLELDGLEDDSDLRSSNAKPVPQTSARRGSLLSRAMEKQPGSRSAAPAGGAPSTLHALVALQRADGTWELSRELAEAIGCDLGRLESQLDTEARSSGSGGVGAVTKQAWATALALAWLELRAAETKDEWRLLAAKARTWLDQCGVAGPAGDTWTDAAIAFLRSTS